MVIGEPLRRGTLHPMNDRIAAAAQGLLVARQENRIALLEPEIAPRDLAEAYAVHLAFLELLSADGGGPRIGWKVGFTNHAAQARMGTTEPVLAGLLSQHSYAGEAEMKSPEGKGLGVEAELAVRLRSPLSGSVSRQEAATAIDAVAIAIEVVQKRGGPDEIGLPTLVADGTLQYGSIFGPWNTTMDPMTIKECDVKLQVDGQTDGFMGATEVLGDPLNALTWLSAASERNGIDLQAGDVILLGAIIPAQHLAPGQMAEVASDGLGDVRLWVD
jgi:2-keto-4-pentenoate hydratase